MRVEDRSVARRAGPEEPFRSMVPDPLERVRLVSLRDAARRALEAPPEPRVEADHIAPVRASVAEAIATVLDRLPENRLVSFRDLTLDAADRLEVIVRFLAVLELYKQGVVDLEQVATFADLSIRRLTTGEALDALSIADWDTPGSTPAPDAEQGAATEKRVVSEPFRGPDDEWRVREARRAIEAVLTAATEPVEPRFLAELVELPVEQVEALCAELGDEYERDGRGFVLRRVAGGYRLQTHPDLAAYVEQFVLEGQHVRLSGPALETLAIVATSNRSRAQVPPSGEWTSRRRCRP